MDVSPRAEIMRLEAAGGIRSASSRVTEQKVNRHRNAFAACTRYCDCGAQITATWPLLAHHMANLPATARLNMIRRAVAAAHRLRFEYTFALARVTIRICSLSVDSFTARNSRESLARLAFITCKTTPPPTTTLAAFGIL